MQALAGAGGMGALARHGGRDILAAPVPVLGANELIGDSSTFANGIGSWTPTRSGALSSVAGVGVLAPGAQTFSGAAINVAATLDRFYQTSARIRLASGAAQVIEMRGPFSSDQDTFIPTADARTIRVAHRVRGTNFNIVSQAASNGSTYEIDDTTLQPIAMASCFSTRAYASADCDLSARVTWGDYDAANKQAPGTSSYVGLCARMDPTSPLNFIYAFLQRDTTLNSLVVGKFLNGVHFNVTNGLVSYAANLVFRLVCSGNNVSAYYNGVQVGSTQVVSDAAIVNNKYHGLFSTYAGNVLANYRNAAV